MKSNYNNLLKAWKHFAKCMDVCNENYSDEICDLMNECINDFMSYEEYLEVKQNA